MQKSVKKSNKKTGAAGKYTASGSFGGAQPSKMCIRDRFIDRRYKKAEHPEDYVFIAANVYDNYALMAHDPEDVYKRQAR